MKLPTHEQIAIWAYGLWETAGKPEGRSLEFWLIAESEVTEMLNQVGDE